MSIRAEMVSLLGEGKGYTIGVTALAKSVRTWAKQLEKMGFSTDIDVFKTGPGGAMHYGPSTVEITIEKEYKDAYGDDADFYESITFAAGGYGGIDDSNIGGTSGWRAMKQEAERRLSKQLDWDRAKAYKP